VRVWLPIVSASLCFAMNSAAFADDVSLPTRNGTLTCGHGDRSRSALHDGLLAADQDRVALLEIERFVAT
jgi:hypothetical protein